MADKKADDVKEEPKDEVLEALKDDEQESPAEPSPAKEEKSEEKPEEVKDKEEADKPAEPESPEPEKKEEPEAEAEEEPEKSEEDKPSKAEERKQQLNTEIRDLVSKRNAIKREVEKANEAYQPATEDELLEQTNPETGKPYTAAEAKIDALNQRLELKDYNERVADEQLTLSSESERVLNDFAWANPESPSYKKELAEEAAEFVSSNLIRDPNTNKIDPNTGQVIPNSGQIIGSNVKLYKYYQTLDRARGISGAEGQLKGQQDTENMLANADSPASAAPQKKTEDPILNILKSDEY